MKIFRKLMVVGIIGLFIGVGCITQNLINVGITVKAYPGEILDSFIIPGNNSLGGLTWDDPYLWIEDNKNLIYKVDSSSGGIFDVISTPISSYGGLAWDGEYLWSAGENDGKIYQIDPSDGTIKHSINSPGPDTNGLAFWGDYLWISDYYTRKIYLMRISNEEVIREFNGPGQYGLHGLAWDGEILWCAKANPGEIFALTSHGVTIGSFPSPSNSPRGLAWDGEFLWNADASTGRIYKINVTGVDNEVPITPQKPQGPSTGQIGKDLLFSVNTIDPDDDDIRYGWDWDGDDVVDEWSDYMSSGSTDTRPHSWMANGTYHIKVLAEDTFEMQSEWSLPLTIEIIKKSDLECNGNMVWNGIVPGDLITSSFTIQNIGDSGTELSWEIVSYPDWGNWTFAPSSGDGLTPGDGSVTVDVFVVAPVVEEGTFTGEIKVVNEDDSTDYEIIPVSLSTPKNKAINPFLLFLERLIEQFPILEQILQPVYDKLTGF